MQRGCVGPAALQGLVLGEGVRQERLRRRTPGMGGPRAFARGTQVLARTPTLHGGTQLCPDALLELGKQENSL